MNFLLSIVNVNELCLLLAAVLLLMQVWCRMLIKDTLISSYNYLVILLVFDAF